MRQWIERYDPISWVENHIGWIMFWGVMFVIFALTVDRLLDYRREEQRIKRKWRDDQ